MKLTSLCVLCVYMSGSYHPFCLSGAPDCKQSYPYFTCVSCVCLYLPTTEKKAHNTQILSCLFVCMSYSVHIRRDLVCFWLLYTFTSDVHTQHKTYAFATAANSVLLHQTHKSLKIASTILRVYKKYNAKCDTFIMSIHFFFVIIRRCVEKYTRNANHKK